MKKNKILAPKDIKLTGRTKAEVISLFGNNYVEDADGNLTYSIRIFLFYKKKIFIGFNESNVVEVVFTL